jgi:hypothetical protein
MMKKFLITAALSASIFLAFSPEICRGECVNDKGEGKLITSTSPETRKAIKDGYDYISYSNVSDCKKGNEYFTLCLNDDEGECMYRFDFEV